MKTQSKLHPRRVGGYALLMVMVICAASIIILSGTVNRTYSVSKLNDRSNQYMLQQNVAEAAVEKVFARMAYEFSTPGLGLGSVRSNIASGLLVANPPSEDLFFSNFEFYDVNGVPGRITITNMGTYTGPLPSQFDINGYPRVTKNAPIYRVIANVKEKNGNLDLTNAVQQDVMLALVPIINTAIFFNSLMEYTWCAEFTINGRVHANGSIYTGSRQRLTFNAPVTSTGIIASPSWAGHSSSEYTYKGTYNGSPGKTTNVPTVVLSINMTNTHSLIEIPPSSEPADSDFGKQRLYNQANIVLLISNSVVTAKLQEGIVPGLDPGIILTSSVSPSALNTNFPFLTLLWGTNGFTDQREGKTILASQIDVSKLKTWLSTPIVTGKFNPGNGEYPTILYVADNRTTTASQLTAVRLMNGISPPANGGLGFCLATPNPLYIWGHYNCPNTAYLGSSDTVAAGTVPCALLSDAITMLSPNWRDNQSSWDLGNSSKNDAASMTVNAAILSGLVYSTGPNTGQFSGGVMNLPRLLENWGNGQNQVLTLNTALINLYSSKSAIAQFRDPGDYYYAPKRNFIFDRKFEDPGQQPPGIPCALMPVRFNWATPPPLTASYNVSP